MLFASFLSGARKKGRKEQANANQVFFAPALLGSDMKKRFEEIEKTWFREQVVLSVSKRGNEEVLTFT